VSGFYRSARPRALVGDRAPTNDECNSTHPANPLALIRRHEPRDSPSCTREPGPIDATIRDPLLASARTTTQLVEMELTQRDVARDLDDVEGFVAGLLNSDGDATALAASGLRVGSTGATGATATIGSAEATLTVSGDGATSRRTPLSIGTLGTTASPDALAVRDSTESMGLEAESSLCTAAARARVASSGRVLRVSHTTPSDNTAAATPMPFKRWGPIGGRSGWVPHHLHDPRLSG
jgi:hypothetical protein